MDKKTVRNLQCSLTRDERLIYAGDLAKAEQDKISVEERLKELKDEFKLKLSQIEVEIGKKSRAINNGYEYRDIKCEWSHDWEKGKKTLFRLDTNEIVETDDISEYEKQQEMNLN